ncbi:uncharacterized protein LOC143439194 isoform X1 [Arvicanthis niloticus]|uniref:uncharacterized protein LOC143439194 isoform X1 n=1 Tax=Arvicanthis niloticus TaxID=61156 RepID=UPI00403CDE7F
MGTAASALRGPRSFPHSAMREKSPTALSPTMSHMFLWLPVVTWDELGDTCIWRTGLWSVLLQELQLLSKSIPRLPRTAQSPGGSPPEGAAPEPAELGRETWESPSDRQARRGSAGRDR